MGESPVPNLEHSFESRFSKYGEQLTAFSQKHNLLISKYYHGVPSWSFCFEHPKGGQSKLELIISEYDEIKLSSIWWVDNHKKFTRSLKWRKVQNIEKTSTAITEAMEQQLADVLNWVPGRWTQVVNDYKNIWGRYSEAEFNAMTPVWPKVVP